MNGRFKVLTVGKDRWIVRGDRSSWDGFSWRRVSMVSRVYAHVDDAQAVADWLNDKAAGYPPRAEGVILATGVTL
jgi:hypothetical protein